MNFTGKRQDLAPRVEHSADEGMVYIPGGTFRMGSDRHYPEEAPVHRVTVDGFWMDRTPVTNRQFREFVNATGYVTFAEITPDAKDFTSPIGTPKPMPDGSARNCRPRPNGNSPHVVDWR